MNLNHPTSKIVNSFIVIQNQTLIKTQPEQTSLIGYKTTNKQDTIVMCLLLT